MNQLELQRYLSELKWEEFVRNPFSASLVVANILDELNGQFCDLRNNSWARGTFNATFSVLMSWMDPMLIVLLLKI